MSSVILPNIPLAAQADLDATNGNVAALAARVAKLEAPPYDPRVLWRAGMETGNISEWSGETVSGTAANAAVKAAAEGIPQSSPASLWVLKQSVTGAAGGARMQRYPEIDALARTGTPFYYSFKAYFPGPVSFGIYDMFQLVSINSCEPVPLGAAPIGDPIWGLFTTGSGFMPQMIWSPNSRAPAEGPHAGETGKRIYGSTTPIPVGAWTFFEIYLKPAADFTGALKVWMGGNVLFDFSAIKTMHPIQPAGLPQWIDKDAYGSGLTPTPYSHYVDDVTVSLGRMLA
jgi:hypothetical protein